MRALFISLLSLTILVVSWSIFLVYAGNAINDMVDILEYETIEKIKNENWQNAQKSFKQVIEIWQSKRKIYSVFFDANSIGEIEGTIAKAKAYINSQDQGSAVAEIAHLQQQFSFLLENEKVTLENIF
ncbi:MAG: DUF4363 family protein [Clostridiales bacterium]|nr:DUF4363 family protein [Clostridiales bacterium]